MIKTVTEVINGNEYVITTFSAIKGQLILIKLVKYLRGGAEILDSVSDFKNILDSDINIGKAIEKIIEDVNPDALNDLICTMLKNVSYQNKFMTKEFIEQHFAANYMEMYTLIIAIIKANYINEGTKSFFAQARQKLNPQALAQSAKMKDTADTQKA